MSTGSPSLRVQSQIRQDPLQEANSNVPALDRVDAGEELSPKAYQLRVPFPSRNKAPVSEEVVTHNNGPYFYGNLVRGEYLNTVANRRTHSRVAMLLLYLAACVGHQGRDQT